MPLLSPCRYAALRRCRAAAPLYASRCATRISRRYLMPLRRRRRFLLILLIFAAAAIVADTMFFFFFSAAPRDAHAADAPYHAAMPVSMIHMLFTARSGAIHTLPREIATYMRCYVVYATLSGASASAMPLRAPVRCALLERSKAFCSFIFFLISAMRIFHVAAPEPCHAVYFSMLVYLRHVLMPLCLSPQYKHIK